MQSQLEEEAILRLLKKDPFKSLLEVGCANGHLLRLIRKEHPDASLTGVDFTPDYIERARMLGGDVAYSVGNVERLRFNDCMFNIVVSKRCLINLASDEAQQNALRELKRVLKPNGTLILLESTVQGYKALNDARRKVGLPPVKIAKHNHPLNNLNIVGFKGRQHECLGAYYYLTRVFYPLTVKEPEYNTDFHQKAAQVQQCLGDVLPDVSPVILWSLRKT